MARTITKGGMHCKRCGPTVGEKDKHGLRNVTSLALTGGATAKIEKWHCRNCGGPVSKSQAAKTEKRSREAHARMDANRDARDAAEKQRLLDRAGIVIDALPKPNKPASGRGNQKAFRLIIEACKAADTFTRGELDEALENLPLTITPLGREEADRFKRDFEDLGGKAALKPPEVGAEMRIAEAAARTPEDDGDETDASTAKVDEIGDSAKESPDSATLGTAPSGDVLEQLRKLGELRDAGVLTEEEFDSKKSELLSRL